MVAAPPEFSTDLSIRLEEVSKAETPLYIKGKSHKVGRVERYAPYQRLGVCQVIGLTEIRAIAMALPQVEEGPPVRAARRVAAFKVAGMSFIGVEAGGRSITVSLPEEEARALAAEDPKAYGEVWRNGKTLVGLRVDLSRVSALRVRELIERSWRH